VTRAEFLEKWKAQCAEWDRIGDELGMVTAYAISLEQRKRALAEGRKLVTYADLEAASS
jgi:hypothetical protein